MSAKGLRRYALAMAVLNLLATLVLSGMLMVNTAYGSPNMIVATMAPLAIATFAIVAIMWGIQAFVAHQPSRPLTLKGARNRA